MATQEPRRSMFRNVVVTIVVVGIAVAGTWIAFNYKLDGLAAARAECREQFGKPSLMGAPQGQALNLPGQVKVFYGGMKMTNDHRLKIVFGTPLPDGYLNPGEWSLA